MPPIGGRNTFRSGRSTSSGYMPAVCSCRPWRSSVSLMLKRCAMPGRYQTGSIAAFTTRMPVVPVTILPSMRMRLSAIASRISGMSILARVIAMVGRMS